MTTRREFVRLAALLSAGLSLSPALLAASAKYIGLQLYTVRDAMQQDPVGTLAKVAALGYNSVEGATYTGSQKFYGMVPADFAKVLKQHGLTMASSHYVLGEQLNNGQALQGTILHGWDKAVDDAAAAGVKYMVCAYLFDNERGNLDHYKQIADHFNKAGERCQKAGIQLCYHNHNFEFVAQDGKLPYDVLLAQADKNLVKMELDLYWAVRAGQDPVALFRAHPGRFPLWHIKDMDKTEQHGFTEIGNGSIDFKRLFAQRKLAGLQYFYVEQDQTPGSPFDSIKQSIAYIKRELV